MEASGTAAREVPRLRAVDQTRASATRADAGAVVALSALDQFARALKIPCYLTSGCLRTDSGFAALRSSTLRKPDH